MTAKLALERALAEAHPGCRIAGIDEAGRGPLAGPVFAAAVSLPLALAEELADCAWREIDDSKRLSPARRERLAETVKSTPGCSFAVCSASAAEIDRLNILNATHLAMRRACEALLAGAGEGAAFAAIVDGLPVRNLPFPSEAAVKGDSRSLLVGAASILAKCARDSYCETMDAAWPDYGFSRHKGYGTPEHLDALARLGPCPEHRKSFAPVRQRYFDFNTRPAGGKGTDRDENEHGDSPVGRPLDGDQPIARRSGC